MVWHLNHWLTMIIIGILIWALGRFIVRRKWNGAAIPFNGRTGKFKVNTNFIHDISADDHIVDQMIAVFINEEVNIQDVD